jgi:hypothetical protein
MVLRKKGKYAYGDDQADLRKDMEAFALARGYQLDHTADAICVCGGTAFELFLDEDAGVASRVCRACSGEHLIADSADFVDEAECEQSVCVCGETAFEITIGVSLYRESEDVRWLYVGCRCVACDLVGVYGDWKNEFIGYRDLLART